MTALPSSGQSIDEDIHTGTNASNSDISSSSRITSKTNSTLTPSQSASNRLSDTTTMSKLALDDVAFKEYLDATRCVYQLDKDLSQETMSEEIMEILGELPEMPDVYDLSVHCIAECLEPSLNFLASQLPEWEKEVVRDRARKLYKDWELTVDWNTVYKRLELAVLVAPLSNLDTRRNLAIPYAQCLRLLLCNPPAPQYSRLHTKPHFFVVLNLLQPYAQIPDDWSSDSWGAMPAELWFRGPLDQLTKAVWNEPDKKYCMVERYTVPVKPSRHIDLNLGNYFKPNLTIVKPFRIFDFDCPDLVGLLQEYSNYLRLLAYNPCDTSGLGFCIALVEEFKVLNLEQAVNQCIAALMCGAALNELLDIPFPIYGAVITLNACAVYAARAQIQSDGALKYAVQKVHHWGTLMDFSNYMEYIRFLVNHKEWFMKTVNPLFQERAKEDLMWVISKLKRVHVNPWNPGN